MSVTSGSRSPQQSNGTHPHLARTLGPGSIIMIGIGSLIGGGVFTLLGPAAGMAGPGLVFAMILGAGIAFLNLQMYLALGTTFPEAGGGYLWVRKGLGNFQGFMAGWLSWFAHAAACGVYALSFGYYAEQLLNLANIHIGLFERFGPAKVLAILVVLVFGYVNWRGAKMTGVAGNVITVVLLGILALFVGSGIFRMFAAPAIAAAQFTPLLPNGIFGIFAATSFFYIAFEGSEIQVQAGEETKDPARDLKIGLLVSWAVVTALYALISIVVIGAMPGDGGAAWQQLSGFGEGAIVRAAATFMPFGALLMTVAGLLANLAALNATIYSSSHVSFALARDNNIWAHLSRIHLKNLTPDLAVIASTALIAIMVATLPLFDVASAASLLFVLLFAQLNAAGINIHFKFPDTKWKYKVPLFPLLPLLATAMYAVLALTMFRINANAWVITIVWSLIGLVDYFAYAIVKGRQQFENKIVYEETLRVTPQTSGKKILLPIGPAIDPDDLQHLSHIAIAIASRIGAEVIVVKIHEVLDEEGAIEPSVVLKDRQIFENIKGWVADYNDRMPGTNRDVNFHNLVLAGRDVTDVILDVTKIERCDLLIMSWSGYTLTKGVVFGSKIDRILREAQCDLLVMKDPKPVGSLTLAVNPKGKNPYLEIVGLVFKAMTDFYKPKRELLSIVGQELPVYMKPDPSLMLRKLGLTERDFDSIRFVPSRSIAKGIIDNTGGTDLVIVGASKPKFLKDIRFGSIPESIAKHGATSLLIVKGHAGIAEAFWTRALAVFRGLFEHRP